MARHDEKKTSQPDVDLAADDIQRLLGKMGLLQIKIIAGIPLQIAPALMG